MGSDLFNALHEAFVFPGIFKFDVEVSDPRIYPLASSIVQVMQLQLSPGRLGDKEIFIDNRVEFDVFRGRMVVNSCFSSPLRRAAECEVRPPGQRIATCAGTLKSVTGREERLRSRR